MTGAHSLDRLIGNEYPTFPSGADVFPVPSNKSLTLTASPPRAPMMPLSSGPPSIPMLTAIQFLPNADPADTPIVITHRDFVARA